jgi:glycosyltransferase involved in cell wall biosynthesis
VCDGRLAETRCTSCTLHGLGVNRGLSHLVASAPVPVTFRLGALAAGRVSTALRMPDAMRARVRVLREFFNLPDRFVALTPWVRDLLLANGVAGDRISLSRHGLDGSPRRAPVRVAGPLRIAHLGRLDPVKGTALLIRAVRTTAASVQLDIFGLLQGPSDAVRLAALQEASGGDERVRFLPPLDPQAVIDTLSNYDVVAVPSQWLETGPLVVLEAHAAGIPVIGSALGGIAEKIRDGVDGVLVDPHASLPAWRAAIDRLARDPGLVQTLKTGVCPPRPLKAVGEEMRDLYASLVPTTGEAFKTAV